MKRTYLSLLALAVIGSAAAAPLPDYPIVYSPEAGGPVANPAYAARPKAPAASQVPPASQIQPEEAPQTPPLRYTLEINAGYGFKAVPDSKFACDVTTVELEGAYYLVPHHALTLSLGYASGGTTRDYWLHDGRHYQPFTDSYDRSSFTLMAGYRYSRMLGRYIILQAGAKAGMDIQTLNVDYGPGWHPYPYGLYDGQDGAAVGFAYAGYANLGFFVTPNTCLHVGYQFRGSTATPSADSEIPDVPKFRTHAMRWHEIRAGITVHF